jgi:hypothetical protein
MLHADILKPKIQGFIHKKRMPPRAGGKLANKAIPRGCWLMAKN